MTALWPMTVPPITVAPEVTVQPNITIETGAETSDFDDAMRASASMSGSNTLLGGTE